MDVVTKLSVEILDRYIETVDYLSFIDNTERILSRMMKTSASITRWRLWNAIWMSSVPIDVRLTKIPWMFAPVPGPEDDLSPKLSQYETYCCFDILERRLAHDTFVSPENDCADGRIRAHVWKNGWWLWSSVSCGCTRRMRVPGCAQFRRGVPPI